MKLINTTLDDINTAMEIIDEAKAHLKEQGIDQWQNGYPDYNCIKSDAEKSIGYFIIEEEEIIGYLCMDFSGEPAYNTLEGSWSSDRDYVVVHRMAFSNKARGNNLASQAFSLVEEHSRAKGVNYFRIDTDEDNKKMQHIIKKNGFTYCGVINFDNSEKIAFDKEF